MGYELERACAVEAVIQAARLCRKVQAAMNPQGVLGKRDGSPVTVADFGAQALIAHSLVRAFPKDMIVGEEQSGALRENSNADLKEEVVRQVKVLEPHMSSEEILEAIDRGAGSEQAEGRFWTVDPIDGTKGFIRGDQYAIALALLEEGRVVLGVLGCPNLPLEGEDSLEGSLFVAVKGEGAALRGFEAAAEKEIRVSDINDPYEALICESMESSHASHGDSARVAETLGISKPPLRMDSQCKYGIVSRGEATIYLRITSRRSYLEKIWDHTAGALLVEEAGGRVTDLEGKPLDFFRGREMAGNRGIVATNGKVHDAVLEAVRRLGL